MARHVDSLSASCGFINFELTIFAHEVGSFWTFEFTNELLFSVDLAANLKTAIFWDHIFKIFAAWIFDFINWFFIFLFLIIWFFFIVFRLVLTINTCTKWFVEFPDSLFVLFTFCLGIAFESLAYANHDGTILRGTSNGKISEFALVLKNCLLAAKPCLLP